MNKYMHIYYFFCKYVAFKCYASGFQRVHGVIAVTRR